MNLTRLLDVQAFKADYLTLRYQHVVVEGEKSTGAQVLSGIPQGSVLGPLLFLIYVDGINNLSL